jgi:hypothetical protein
VGGEDGEGGEIHGKLADLRGVGVESGEIERAEG